MDLERKIALLELSTAGRAMLENGTVWNGVEPADFARVATEKKWVTTAKGARYYLSASGNKVYGPRDGGSPAKEEGAAPAKGDGGDAPAKGGDKAAPDWAVNGAVSGGGAKAASAPEKKAPSAYERPAHVSKEQDDKIKAGAKSASTKDLHEAHSGMATAAVLVRKDGDHARADALAHAARRIGQELSSRGETPRHGFSDKQKIGVHADAAAHAKTLSDADLKKSISEGHEVHKLLQKEHGDEHGATQTSRIATEALEVEQANRRQIAIARSGEKSAATSSSPAKSPDEANRALSAAIQAKAKTLSTAELQKAASRHTELAVKHQKAGNEEEGVKHLTAAIHARAEIASRNKQADSIAEKHDSHVLALQKHAAEVDKHAAVVDDYVAKGKQQNAAGDVVGARRSLEAAERVADKVKAHGAQAKVHAAAAEELKKQHAAVHAGKKG